MAKQWKSLWDDFDDEGNGPEETKKSSGPRPNPHYRGDREAAEDELASDEYGGFGWNGNFSSGSSGGSYRYDDAFDDSDTQWYRKNSFRYGKHADYSPSSLFRSAFSRSYSSGDDNDAKNKAIRALRNLTRSANTIVDKSTGIKNEFAVQFSAGADSNGPTAELNAEKQRVVYVSPDDLLASKTTEDEDGVIDALTGFVLLRVQMAQDIAADVINKINRTSSHLAGVRIAAQFSRLRARSLTEYKSEELHAISGNAVDEYLAGMLAKSVLMRLARRQVVQNWGGFAPYFIRHAKKFAAVKANLEAADLSVESVVSKLGYNMLADEEPIAVDKEFEDIAAKHLGEEVEMTALLPACKKMVEDIREAMTKRDDAAPGEMEAALNEMLDKAQQAQKSDCGTNEDLRNFLTQLGTGMANASDAADESRAEREAASDAETALSEKLRASVSMDQLIKKITAEVAQMNRMLEDLKSENPAVVEAANRQVQQVRYNINYLMQSRPQAMAGFNAGGLQPVADDLLHEGRRTDSGDAATKELQKKAAQFLEKAGKFAKERRETLKKESEIAVNDMAARIEKYAELLERDRAAVAKIAENIKTAAGVNSATKESAETVLNNMVTALQTAIDRMRAETPHIAKNAETIEGARSSGTVEKSHKQARVAANNALAQLSQFAHHAYGWYGAADLVQRLMRALAHLISSTADKKNAVAEAVEDVISSKAVSPAAFAAEWANAAAGGSLDDLEDFADEAADDGEEADDGSDLRMSRADIQRMRELRESVRAAGLRASGAVAAGEEAAAKLQKTHAEFSPVDGELFGEKIAATTKILDSESIGRVNDEARNDPEEEYIAYLSHNSAKPRVGTVRARGTSERSTNAITVKEVRAQHRGSIERIRNALQFQSGKRTADNFGLRSGDLDEGSLHKLGYDCDHIWSQKTVSKLPDVAVGILVDQSGSMAGLKIEQARTMCIILAEALKKIAGVRLYVYGHTANNGSTDLTIYEHYTPTSTDMTTLGSIRAYSNNYDGYAIKDVAKRLSADQAKSKYLFVIADGLPSGHGYGGDTAEKHVASVCKFVRDRLKIGLNAFAVGVAGHQHAAFKKQYGDDHVVFINNIMTCLPQIVRFLRNTLQKERKLVGVEA